MVTRDALKRALQAVQRLFHSCHIAHFAVEMMFVSRLRMEDPIVYEERNAG